jgi:antitoxin component YwqK of YwqJK toxin-antitoxin module
MFYTCSGSKIQEEGMKTAILMLVLLSWTCPAAQAKGKVQDGLYKIYKGTEIQNLATAKKLKLDGVAFQYYKNGDIQRQSWYENNKLHGQTTIFSAEKKLAEVKVYDQGRLTEIVKPNAAQ